MTEMMNRLQETGQCDLSSIFVLDNLIYQLVYAPGPLGRGWSGRWDRGQGWGSGQVDDVDAVNHSFIYGWAYAMRVSGYSFLQDQQDAKHIEEKVETKTCYPCVHQHYN
jgi:hypothetical protein